MSATGIVSFKATQADIEESPIAPDKLIEGHPQQRSENYHTSADEHFFSGFWSSTPGKWHVNYAGEEEFCHLLEGEIILADQQGNESRFKAGDRFAISEGFTGTWETVVACRKLYVIALKG
ncbi:cupin domain-containing protein [Kordiimonas sp.]|uniref:cupin domain-containing protein n=1 Tax=Kordiimonas sp. TaxID=1970157 RepID=UPI003A8CDE2C